MLKLVLIFLFLWLPQNERVKYRIINMSSSEIVIGGQVKRIGDDFYDTEKISWPSSSETITVVNLTTRGLFCFSACEQEAKEKVEKEELYNNQGSLCAELLVTMAPDISQSLDFSFFYLLYEKEGKTEMVPLLSRGEIEGLEGEVYLVRHDNDNNADILISDDFMALEEELTKADDMAKDQMEASGKSYYVTEEAVRDYMDIMLRLTKKYFGDIEYTYEELKILMSTK